MSSVPVPHAALDLAIGLVNTYDLLEPEPDRLSIRILVALARRGGYDDLAERLAAAPEADALLDRVREIRGRFYRIFEAGATGDAAATIAALNEALDAQPLRPAAVALPDGTVRLSARLTAARSGGDPVARPGEAGGDPVARSGGDPVARSGGDPVAELAAIAVDALAQAMAVGGPGRFGTCAGNPCKCAYVDRTRAGRQRFCCQLCNDRMAAAAYRSRRAGASATA